jgi:hypothetical protein
MGVAERAVHHAEDGAWLIHEEAGVVERWEVG